MNSAGDRSRIPGREVALPAGRVTLSIRLTWLSPRSGISFESNFLPSCRAIRVLLFSPCRSDILPHDERFALSCVLAVRNLAATLSFRSLRACICMSVRACFAVIDRGVVLWCLQEQDFTFCHVDIDDSGSFGILLIENYTVYD